MGPGAAAGVEVSGGAGGGGGGGQPPHMSTELVRTLWPMLEAVPGRMGGSPEVMRQLFLLVGKLLTSLRMVLARQVHIPTLLKMIMDSYDEHQYPCCLDIMTTAVEVYGAADEAVEHFRALLGRASTRTFTTVQVRLTEFCRGGGGGVLRDMESASNIRLTPVYVQLSYLLLLRLAVRELVCPPTPTNRELPSARYGACSFRLWCHVSCVVAAASRTHPV